MAIHSQTMEGKMLEEVKQRGDLVAALRPTGNSAYIEGTIQRVFEEKDGYFYEIAWEDGAHFEEMFHESELDEIDLDESEAILRVSMAEFLPERALDEWLELPNGRLLGLTPYDALESLGLKRVADALIDDYSDALQRAADELEPEERDEDTELEDQLGDIFGSQRR